MNKEAMIKVEGQGRFSFTYPTTCHREALEDPGDYQGWAFSHKLITQHYNIDGKIMYEVTNYYKRKANGQI